MNSPSPNKQKTKVGTSVLVQVFKTLVSILILTGAIGGAWALSLLKEKPAETTPEQLVPQVRVSEVKPYQGNLDLAITGTVVPHREVRLAAEVGGRIAYRSEACRAGSLVQKGDLLVEIDPENFELALKTAEAEVSQSKVMLQETAEEISGLKENVRLSNQQLEILQADFNRNSRLGNVVSQSELDQSKRALLEAETQHSTRANNLATATARLERMKAAVELSQRRLERARLDLERTGIRAPFEGVVVKSMVEQDDFIQAGTVLVHVEDTSRVEVLCNLQESELEWLRSNAPADVPGQTSSESGMRTAYRLPQVPVTIHDTRYPELTWSGRLDRFDGIGRDEMTKAIPVRIVVEEPLLETPSGPKALVRGMYVQCRLEVERGAGESAETLLKLPAVAVRPGGLVWVFRDGKLVSRQVKPLTSVAQDAPEPGLIPGVDSRMVIIRPDEKGLQAGDRVVVSPLSQAADGIEVRLEAEAPPVPAASPGLQEASRPADKGSSKPLPEASAAKPVGEPGDAPTGPETRS